MNILFKRVSRFLWRMPFGIVVLSFFSFLFIVSCDAPFNADLYDTASRQLVFQVSGIRVSPASLTLGQGHSSQLHVIFSPVNATNRNLSWAVDNSSLATVSSAGRVTAIAASGTVTVTATSEDGAYTSTCVVTLTPSAGIAVTGVVVNPTTANLNSGSSTQLTATVSPTNAADTSVTWSSDNSSVATVNSNGIVTALGAGSAIITVTTVDGGFTATTSVTVSVPVTGVVVNPVSVTVVPGEQVQLNPTISPSGASNTNVTWQSSNNSIATVNSTGLVTAVAGGSATVTATTQDGGFTSSSTITVQDWQVALGGAGGLSAGTSYSGMALALDASGVPYVAFSNGGNGFVDKYNSGTNSWSQVGATFGTSTVGLGDSQLTMAINGSGDIYVAYPDSANSKRAAVSKWNGSSWTAVGAGLSSGVATYLSIKVTGSTPFVSFVDAGNSARVSVMSYDGSSWSAVGTLGFSNPSSTYTSLALDSGGNPFVSLVNAGTAEWVVNFPSNSATLVGGPLTSTTVDSPSLAFASGDVPYVAYIDTSSGQAVRVMNHGASWNNVGPGLVSAGQAAYSALAIDSNNAPFVAYQDLVNGNRATVAKYDGTSWLTVGSAGFSSVQADGVNLVADGSGHVYIGYDNNGTIYVQELK